MATTGLDQLVKGGASPSSSAFEIKSREPSPDEVYDPPSKESTPGPLSDPTVLLPSSPPQIYLNLLILEASLRSQYLTLRARRRQNLFFLTLLAIWNAFFFYALFLQPREDGSGIGGSVYWVIETTEKVALMGGIVTGILIWGTGQWERGVRWPRRFVAVTNRGLRTMNCKIIVLKGSWWKELWSHLMFLFPFSSFYAFQGSNYQYVDIAGERRAVSKLIQDDESETVREEDLAPGGDSIRLLLLPKPFSSDFRENWELYRNEYWEKENERRAHLLQRVRKQQRQVTGEQGGWLWWLDTGSSKMTGSQLRDNDLEKSNLRHPNEKEPRRNSTRREPHVRSTSRSSTPSSVDGNERPPSRGSKGPSSLTEGRKRPRGSFSSNRQTRQGGLNPCAERSSFGTAGKTSSNVRSNLAYGSESEQIRP